MSASSPALVKGSLMHLAHAHHYIRLKARQEGTDPDDWVGPEEAVELIAQEEGVSQFAPLIQKVYRAFAERNEEADESRRILGVEQLHETMIAGKYLLTGRIDLLFEDPDGRVWVLDLKTTGRLTASHKDFYAVSGQLIGYQHLVRQTYGDRVAGMKLNLVEHGGAEPKFEHITLPRSPNLEARFVQTIIDIEESIERMEKSGRAYDDWPKAMSELICVTRYGECPFIHQCRFGAGVKPGGDWSWEG